MALDISAIQSRVPNAFSSAMQGFQEGTDRRKQREEEEQIALQRQQQEAKAKQVQFDLSELMSNPNAGQSERARFLANHPEVADQFMKPFSLMDKAAQENEKSQGIKIYAALKTGNVDVAKQLLDKRLAAAENSGNEQKAAEVNAMIMGLNADPNMTKAGLAIALQSIIGDDFSKIDDQLSAKTDEPSPTSLMKEAAALFPNDKTAQNQWIMEQRAKPGQTINISGDGEPEIGTIAKDYEVYTDEEGNRRSRVIPGSATDTAQKKAAVKSKRAAKSQLFKSKRLLGKIRKARSQTGDTTTGLASQALGWIPWTKAGALQKNIETLKANIGFDKLQQMREDSPTGGALGNVSDRELTSLQSVLANLDSSQDKNQFLENLEEVEAQYERVLSLLESEYDEKSPLFGKSEEEISELINDRFPIFGERSIKGDDQSDIKSLIEKYAD